MTADTEHGLCEFSVASATSSMATSAFLPPCIHASLSLHARCMSVAFAADALAQSVALSKPLSSPRHVAPLIVSSSSPGKKEFIRPALVS